ncbi:hypothetical protein MNB_SV-6-952 [hydrothermal vent metagenome]|uniref:Uncharacterized protein n=1 Tax=hydrothermal vent metagenome TaxID=652676 RepID=A0A1W1C6A4_9ZZZZ
MKISLISILIFMLSLLYGDMSPQYMIFGADKSREQVEQKLSITKDLLSKNKKIAELKDKYNFGYDLVSLGDFYAIKISPIEKYELKEQLVFALKPNFPNLISIDAQQKQNIIYKKYYSAEVSRKDSVSATLLDSIDKSKMKEYAKETHYWLEKWHALIVLLLLGGFFYYRRKHQISKIELQQQDLLKEQNAIETKIKNI